MSDSDFLTPESAQALLNLDKDVEVLRYAGGKRLSALHNLGITKVRDLLYHFPFRYNNFSDIKKIADLRIGEKACVVGRLDEVRCRKVYTRKSGREMSIVEVSLLDDSGVLFASWFNQRWLANKFCKGMALTLLGQIEHFDGFLRINNPLYRILAENDMLIYEQECRTYPIITKKALASIGANIEPVYPAKANLSSTWIAKMVDEALELCAKAPDFLPTNLREKRQFCTGIAALQQLHHPEGRQEYRQARNRLVYEEVLKAQISLIWQRQLERGVAQPVEHITDGQLLSALPKILPFTLTEDQKKAVADILEDMASPAMMNRLLLGDVGSGKTVVALHAILAAVDSGNQAAMVAPTTVLAEQFAIKIGPIFDQLGISWAMLSGANTRSQREQILVGLADGSIQVVFGTHALMEDDVCFLRLTLVVIDEQHRFGVAQRQKLRTKGDAADTLMMSATPIPRSLALIAYGDAGLSVLQARPMPAKVKTSLLGKEMMFVAYDGIRQALQQGHQAFVICPLIDAGEKASPDETDKPEKPELISQFDDFDDYDHIAAATEELKMLRRSIFADYQLELMTSRLSDAEKKSVMDRFRSGEIDILVSTTVVEVGVDVPNATVMLILDADRFGLAQLHQLRGRVGRGDSDGHVFLVTGSDNPESLTRLRIIERIADGFELAEMDLRTRREGDILGLRQHGQGEFKLVNVIRDAELITLANIDAHQLYASDANLESPENRQLGFEVRAMLKRAP